MGEGNRCFGLKKLEGMWIVAPYPMHDRYGGRWRARGRLQPQR